MPQRPEGGSDLKVALRRKPQVLPVCAAAVQIEKEFLPGDHIVATTVLRKPRLSVNIHTQGILQLSRCLWQVLQSVSRENGS